MDQKDSGKAGVGKAFRGNTLKILKEDGGLGEVNECGEILIGGPTLMNGYVEMDELTSQVMIKIDEVIYYKTGDIGFLDQEGILHFKHRKDDLIKIKGFIVNPDEISDKLCSIQGIEEAKIIVNDKDQLIAVMTLNDSSRIHRLQKETTLALKDLDGWCIPDQYYIVKHLPINEMRKSDLIALKEGLRTRALEFLLEWSL
jgi:acyl-CoA synthetase (AMP-forming)/AMP-acid ligase II